jgi:menaquinone-dependent protoporphyrinogen oxidase
MKPIGIFYATREGQTKKIVERIATNLKNRGLKADLKDVRHASDAGLSAYAAAILAASVHSGRHEREMTRFVKRHRAELDQLPTTFISVSLSQTGVERASASPQERESFVADVTTVINKFLRETAWHPKHIRPIAGALLYTRYNPLIRFVMKRIAKSVGAGTDTSLDHEYTDWTGLDRLVEELEGQLAGRNHSCISSQAIA